MKKKFSLFAFIFVFINISFCQWSVLDSGTNEWLRGIDFYDEYNGLAVGYNGTILKTLDGGETWNAVASGTDNDLLSVSFPDETLAIATGSNGTILRSTDGGLTWEDKSWNFVVNMHEVFMVDNTYGYIAGEAGQNLKTIDGGQNWIRLNLFTFNGKVSVFFSNKDVGYFVGIGNEDAIMKTSDAGVSWLALNNIQLEEFTSVYFTDLNHGYITAIRNGARLFRSTEGGPNWQVQELNVDGGVYSIDFFDTKNGYICGGFPNDGIILQTEDEGLTWNRVELPTEEALFDIRYLKEDYAFAVGTNGTILRSGDAPVSTFQIPGKSTVIYPNPTSSVINIKTAKNTHFEVISPQGQTLFEGNYSAGNPINIETLSPGIYFLKIDSSLYKFVKI